MTPSYTPPWVCLLELAGGFGLPLALDTSFHILVHMLITGLEGPREKREIEGSSWVSGTRLRQPASSEKQGHSGAEWYPRYTRPAFRSWCEALLR